MSCRGARGGGVKNLLLKALHTLMVAWRRLMGVFEREDLKKLPRDLGA